MNPTNGVADDCLLTIICISPRCVISCPTHIYSVHFTHNTTHPPHIIYPYNGSQILEELSKALPVIFYFSNNSYTRILSKIIIKMVERAQQWSNSVNFEKFSMKTFISHFGADEQSTGILTCFRRCLAAFEHWNISSSFMIHNLNGFLTVPSIIQACWDFFKNESRSCEALFFQGHQQGTLWHNDSEVKQSKKNLKTSRGTKIRKDHMIHHKISIILVIGKDI